MKIIIIGAYAIGTHLARLLSRNNDDITIIDDDGERLAQIGSDFDLMTMEASPSSINTLTDATRHEVMRLSIDGRRLDKPEKGINIVKYSDGTTRKTIN